MRLMMREAIGPDMVRPLARSRVVDIEIWAVRMDFGSLSRRDMLIDRGSLMPLVQQYPSTWRSQ